MMPPQAWAADPLGCTHLTWSMTSAMIERVKAFIHEASVQVQLKVRHSVPEGGPVPMYGFHIMKTESHRNVSVVIMPEC